MSVHVTSWVLRHSEERLGPRLVLIVLSDHANGDGSNAYPSVETIAREARLDERQARRCLRSLEQSGAIQFEGISHLGTRTYRVVMAVEKSGDRGGDNLSGGANLTEEGGQIGLVEVSEMSPEPSLLQPSKDQPSKDIEAPAGVAVDRRVWKVDRVAVTDEEDSLADQILAEWNQQTGQSLRSKDWLAKFVMRIRERPELGIEDHAHVIHAALAAPWWKGAPTPSVVYGSGAQFERSILAASSGRQETKGERVLRVARELTERGT